MRKHTGALFAGLIVASMAACSTMPNYDAKFGDAVRDARMKMIIDPEAGKSEDQVAGIDGKSAKEAATRYQNTFKAPPPVTNVINIGGSVSSGK